MADITGINLEALGADPVTRGCKFKTLILDYVQSGVAASGAHLIYTVPDNHAVLQAWGCVEETFVTGTNTKFSWAVDGSEANVATTTMTVAANELDSGQVFSIQPTTLFGVTGAAVGGFGQYQNIPSGTGASVGLMVTNVGTTFTAGIIVLYLLMSDVKAAVNAGYREGDGTA